MNFSYDIRQKQQQQFVFSTQMEQSLHILQMPLTELLHKIDEEIIENPVLSCDSPSPDTDPDGALFTERMQMPAERRTADFSGSSSEAADPLLSAHKEPTLQDVLYQQLRETQANPRTARICQYLIADLDERGYLPEDADTIAANLKIADVGEVQKAIALLQSMEPAGIGANGLQACLTLQLQRKPDSCAAEFEIVKHHLPLLANNKIAAIAKNLHLPVADTQKYCDRIRRLNPIPSSGFFTGTTAQFVIPEAIIQQNETGGWAVIMNRTAVRRLFMDSYYQKLLQTAPDKDTQKYLREKIRRASSLIHGVQLRTSTIAKILEKIVLLQPDYFRYGPAALKPMTMQDLAEALHLNESTISRAIQDKYIWCPHGMCCIKSLFTARLGKPEGKKVVSAAAAKEKIREYIQKENKEAPKSDQAIAEILQKAGFPLSRRTVAKYRSELHIPSMEKRKVYAQTDPPLHWKLPAASRHIRQSGL